MDQVKEAFHKVKEDMANLKSEIQSLHSELSYLKDILNNIVVHKNPNNEVPKDTPTNQQTIPTDRQTIPTDNELFKPLNAQNLGISIGNGGVPTDRQTNQQTNQQTQNNLFERENKIPQHYISSPINPPLNVPGKMENAIEILSSLDNLKKEIRLKFKDLTDQEFLVFSTLYTLDEEFGFSDYKTISGKLHLSESSIRDYIGKLIKKEIPIEKLKVNNKSVRLTISQNLKKIASLPTILQLRDL